MFPDFTLLGIFRVKTFSLIIVIASLFSLIFLYLRAKKEDASPLRWVDCGLSGIVGGVILGRAVHVALNWEYFSQHTQRMFQFSRVDMTGMVQCSASSWPLSYMPGWHGWNQQVYFAPIPLSCLLSPSFHLAHAF